MAHHRTTSEVINALGGNAKVADLLKCNPKAVGNWRAFPKFPCKTYLVLKAALAVQGDTAPDSLWNMMLVSGSSRDGEAA